MTKLTIPLLSQNDPRWKPLTIGYNPPNQGWTIGNYGCLITCLSMYLQAIGKPENPDTLNKKLCDNGGYKSGTALLYWNVFANLYGLTEYYVSPRYTGPLTSFAYAKIDELLEAKLPVLTEIDFNPSQQGEQMHYVQILEKIGDKQYKANDPWSGTYIDMNVYGSMDTSVYQFRAYSTPVPVDTTPDCNYYAEAFYSLCTILGIPRNRDIAEQETKKLIAYEDLIKQKDALIAQKDEQVKNVQTEAATLREQVKVLSTTNQQLTESNAGLKNEIQKHDEQLATEKTKIDAALIRIEELEKIQPIEAYGAIDLIRLGIAKLFKRS